MPGLSNHYPEADLTKAEINRDNKWKDDEESRDKAAKSWREQYEEEEWAEQQRREAEAKNLEPYVRFNPEGYRPPEMPLTKEDVTKLNSNHTTIVKTGIHTGYLIPQTGEVLIIPESDHEAFSQHCTAWDQIILDQHLANQYYQLCEEKIQGIWQEKRSGKYIDPERLLIAENAWKTAAQAVNEANEALRRSEEFVGLGSLDPIEPENRTPIVSLDFSKKHMIELIPISPDSNISASKRDFAWAVNYKTWRTTYEADTRTLLQGRFIRNSHSKIIQEGIQEKQWKLRRNEGNTRWEEVFKPEKNGKQTLAKDLGKYVAEQVKGLKLKFFKYQIVPEDAGYFVESKFLRWVEERSASSRTGTVFGRTYDLSTAAALCRYAYGAAFEGEFQPFKGKIAFKTQGQARFALAEAKVDAKLYFPKPDGWWWRIHIVTQDKKKEVINLCEMRLEVRLKPEALIGAVLVAELGVELKLKKKNDEELPTLTGLPSTHPTKRDDVTQVVIDTVPKPASKAAIDVFAGIKVGVELKGALQWRSPEGGRKEFIDLAKIAPYFHGMAGVGYARHFVVDYQNGKFRLSVAAGLCKGVGAKGGLDFEVDVDELASFLKWIYYQLYNSNFSLMAFLTTDGFDAWKYYQYLKVVEAKAKETIKRVPGAEYVGREFKAIEKRVNKYIEDFRADVKKGNMRRELAENISNYTTDVRHSPPEVRGMLIYQLISVGMKEAEVASDSFGILDTERKAILVILLQTQTVRDFDNTLQHIHPNGEKNTEGKEGKYLNGNHRFLAHFMNSDNTGSILLRLMGIRGRNFKGQLDRAREIVGEGNAGLLAMNLIRDNLHETPAYGIPVVPNSTLEYDLYRDSRHQTWGDTC